MPTAIIADDEELARSDLRRLLAEVWPALEIVAECEHGVAASLAIQMHQPDIAFLDIRMPGLNGLEVAQAVSGCCHAVFTTAFSSHAFEAFEAGAIDYLLKPISPERLLQSVARLRERINLSQTVPDLGKLMTELNLRIHGEPVRPRIRWISASVGDSIKVFSMERILFFQSEEKYTRVVAIDDEAHVRKSIKELSESLDTDQFWQIHRSVIVRADAIARARRDAMGRITVEIRGSDEKLKVSQAYAWRFRSM